MTKKAETYQQNKVRFPLWVAKRYLFSKKSHNAVNIISAISAMGVCVGTIALVCVLSVFNGFGTLVEGMFSNFDPDLKISSVQGKTFHINTPEFEKIKKLRAVKNFSEVIEETALLSFNGKQMPATIMGVSETFKNVTLIDSIMYDGKFLLNIGGSSRLVAGIGVANKLGLNAHLIDPLVIYAPKRTGRINIVNPESSFHPASVYISGVFKVNQPDYDDQFVLISLNLAREIFEYDANTVSSLELKMKPGVNTEQVKKEIRTILGNKFKVLNKYEQQEDYFKITQIEKWMTYLILCFILLIATFNIIGSLSMLIIEKKEDIEILRNLGADNKLIKRIFLFEGWLISLVGATIGVILGIIFVLLQQKFGILRMGGDNYVVDSYPVVLYATDVIISFITVLILGFLAVLYPVKYISGKNQLNQV